MFERRTSLVACAGLLLLTLLVFRSVLFPADAARYPWGSDTLGHVLKANELRRAAQGGELYPDLQPAWYMGAQMLRYYPPLPYYLLAALSYPAGDGVAAAHWFVALCAFAGG
ncbi:MAG TPA: hypothetical protein VNL77_24195, partial [Roseiflexaceae bacterium]|nr:hypothetical protein [Roseiflexaceae bacterium]